MRIIAAAISLILIIGVLVDSFETIVVPRRVMHRFRYARLYYRGVWSVWKRVALGTVRGKRREAMLSWFGPLSLMGLFVTWVMGLIFGFALLHWSLASPLHGPEAELNFLTYLYMSGITFFTLGYGDVTPAAPLGRLLAVTEAGMGIGFLAAVISYFPVLFQAFSRREAMIGLLDARAGSPPTAAQFLLRLARSGSVAQAHPLLAEWERWSAELLESHLSFPVLSYYRSQHDNQSWLAALTAILDACSILIVGLDDGEAYQAQLTFAMARHAAVDLGLVMSVRPQLPESDRLPAAQLLALRKQLQEAGLKLREGAAVDQRLAELRGMYEPFVVALANRCLFALPPIVPEKVAADNWQRSPRFPRPPGIGSLSAGPMGDTHFG